MYTYNEKKQKHEKNITYTDLNLLTSFKNKRRLRPAEWQFRKKLKDFNKKKAAEPEKMNFSDAFENLNLYNQMEGQN